MKARLAWLPVIVAFLLACDKKSTEPIVPPPPPPPAAPVQIEAESPPARSSGVPYDSAIWVQFKVPVDTTTISDRTVFFKVDTRRQAATRTWDPATRRLRIVPATRLSLRTTYTVELAPSIRFEDGSALGQSYAWQFTTNSLRRLESPLPMDGSTDQSPFVSLRWGGLTEGSAGTVRYEIHAGPDSASARNTVLAPEPPLVLTSGALFVPRTRWRQDGPVYWAVHAINSATGERLIGPVWSFHTFPADAAFDSVAVAILDWNWVESNNTGRQRCTEDSLVMGVRANIISTMRWNMGVPDTTVRLTGAAIEMTPRYGNVPAAVGPSVWYTTTAFPGCTAGVPATGPPNTEETDSIGKLADAIVLRPDRIRFQSDALAAHVEASRRLGGLYGYLFRADRRRSYFGGGAGSPAVRAVLWLYVYRPPPAPALAEGRRDR